MDFFDYQDKARRNTKWLLVLYIAAVASIMVMANLLVAVVANFQDSEAMAAGSYQYSWELFGLVNLGVLLLVGGGTLYRISSLSGGGGAVAEMLNGELLADAGGDPAKRRLLNVVEEMAIASGTPVPPVYLIPDPAINAFAAGYESGDAVIGITEGALRNLDRDQLQGVIAHEFSHILNGDMRLNIRLMGVLFGILMLAVVGRIVLHSSRGGSRRNDGAAALLAAGLGMIVLGYVGKFFGGLIKAAVSRQREYLADASAVQFTRHKSGISGALKRIGGYEAGSVLNHPESEEISHAFFAGGVKFSFSRLMSTHPPLEERIRRIEPDWNGDYLSVTAAEKSTAETSRDKPAPRRSAQDLAAGFAATIALNPDRVLSELGAPGEPQLVRARELLAAIPAPLAVAAHEPYSARALVYMVLLDRQAEVRRHQLEGLQVNADPNVFRRLLQLLEGQSEIAPQLRLPLLEMAMPALRQLTRSQYEMLMRNVDGLIRADKKIGLSEWALQKFIAKHLGEAFDKGTRGHLGFSRDGSRQLAALKSQITCLLSMLARSEASSSLAPEASFEQGCAQLNMDLELMAPDAVTLENLNASIDALAQLRPLLKPRLLKACMATIVADGVATPVEVELVRTIADALDCPLPPLGM